MNLNYLETLIAVARHLNFSQAARSLNLTQPAVSKHISLLEQHYGVRLVNRTSRRVGLTDAGQVLYDYAVQLMDTVNHAYEDVSSFSGEIKGRLRIGASTIPGHYILPPLIGEFTERFPGVQPYLEISNTGQITALLRKEAIHIGAVGAPVVDDDIACLPFADDELVLAVPAGHRFAGQKEIDPSALAGERLVSRESQSGTRKIIEEWFTQAGIGPDTFVHAGEFGSTEAVLAAVAAGLGISFVSRWPVNGPGRQDRIRTLGVRGLSIKRRLYLIYARNRVITRPTQAFIDSITAKSQP